MDTEGRKRRKVSPERETRPPETPKSPGRSEPKPAPKTRPSRKATPQPIPCNWNEVIDRVERFEISHTVAAGLLGMTPPEMRLLYSMRTGERLPRAWHNWREWIDV